MIKDDRISEVKLDVISFKKEWKISFRVHFSEHGANILTFPSQHNYSKRGKQIHADP